MAKALIADHPGGPEVMVWRDLPTEAPGPGEALIRHTAIGVNFIDIYHRSGLYPWASAPMIPGAEAAGVVEAVGPGVSLTPGTRVAYVLPHGAYREVRVVAAERLVPLPAHVSDIQAAASLLKGLTAQYLVTACHKVQPGDRVLVHAAAGGVGQILGPWLRDLGAVAIGTAGGPEKVALARANGYAHVIDYRSEDFVARVREITGGEGVVAAYDSVGRDTWRGSLACLARRGIFVNFGQSSGMIEGFALSDLARGGSLSAVRPVLFDYIATRAELLERTGALFARLGADTPAPLTLPLQDAPRAHAALEARATTGSVVLLP